MAAAARKKESVSLLLFMVGNTLEVIVNVPPWPRWLGPGCFFLDKMEDRTDEGLDTLLFEAKVMVDMSILPAGRQKLLRQARSVHWKKEKQSSSVRN